MFMKKRVVYSFLWLLVMASGFAQTKVQNLLVEHLTNPIGVETTQPRFNWQLLSDKRNVLQKTYEIRVGSDPSSLASNKDLVWNSGKVSSDSSINVFYKGTPLQSGKRYYWQVREWD